MDETIKSRNYAKLLGREDFFIFDIDEDSAQMDREVPQPELAPAQPAPAPQPEPAPEPVATSVDTLPDALPVFWAEKAVGYARDQQLLYEPRPTRPVVAIKLDKDLMIPKGDYLVFRADLRTFFHLTDNECSAVLQPGQHQTTDLAEAMAVSMAPLTVAPPVESSPPPVVAEPALPPEYAPQPDVGRPRKPEPEVEETAEIIKPPAKPTVLTLRPHQPQDVGSQIGRLIFVIGSLQEVVGNDQINSATIKKYMNGKDAGAMSAALATAQHQGYVTKNGHKPDGRSFYYCLTEAGKNTRRLLGESPFTSVGMRPPFGQEQGLRRDAAGAH